MILSLLHLKTFICLSPSIKSVWLVLRSTSDKVSLFKSSSIILSLILILTFFFSFLSHKCKAGGVINSFISFFYHNSTYSLIKGLLNIGLKRWADVLVSLLRNTKRGLVWYWNEESRVRTESFYKLKYFYIKADVLWRFWVNVLLISWGCSSLILWTINHYIF